MGVVAGGSLPETYPLVNIHKAIEAMAIEIVDFPSYKMVIFHSYVNVYQRGYHLNHLVNLP